MNEAEQSLLGAIILDNDCLINVIDILESEEYFYEPINKKVYKAILKLFQKNEKIDFIKVLDEITKESKENENEIKCYLLEIVKIVPSISSARAYAKIIKNKYNIRQIQNISKYAKQETEKTDNAEEIIENIENKLEKLIESKTEGKAIKLKEALIKTLWKIDKIRESKDGITGIKTGYPELDREISGLNEGELIIIAGRPGMGKTTFALNIAKNISKSHKVLFFSLEMSTEQLTIKAIDEELGEQIKNLDYKEATNEKLKKALEELGKLELYIDDNAHLTTNKINSKLKIENNTELIIIDHLQLIESLEHSGTRVQEISEITRSLKLLAKSERIPIVCLSQLSRSTEGRTDKRPKLSDLRDSGSIEQDADVVLLLYREGYYDKSEKVDEKECEVIISKNRHGETKTIKLEFDGKISRFSPRNSWNDPDCRS